MTIQDIGHDQQQLIMQSMTCLYSGQNKKSK